MPDTKNAIFFQLFNEIGIIAQLSRALFEARLPDGLLVSHFSVLNHLIRVGDGPTPLTLARAFQVPKTTMTHTLSILERHGFVQMRPNPDDKRSKQVWITDAGREFRDQAIQSLGPDIAELSKRYSVDDVQTLLPHLTQLRQIMDQQRD
ncbi:MarR family winged helix-turn-helix transcriptional regulator [Yoonia sp. 2307UL14-13]|uniref:MarR family winged helix-turn-helix transcriptional regulator n=1 Tax=Yoonia sp. 2307UL14-13 TaxID=3126506 RepID=UPI00309DF8FF